MHAPLQSLLKFVSSDPQPVSSVTIEDLPSSLDNLVIDTIPEDEASSNSFQSSDDSSIVTMFPSAYPTVTAEEANDVSRLIVQNEIGFDATDLDSVGPSDCFGLSADFFAQDFTTPQESHCPEDFTIAGRV